MPANVQSVLLRLSFCPRPFQQFSDVDGNCWIHWNVTVGKFRWMLKPQGGKFCAHTEIELVCVHKCGERQYAKFQIFTTTEKLQVES